MITFLINFLFMVEKDILIYKYKSYGSKVIDELESCAQKLSFLVYFRPFSPIFGFGHSQKICLLKWFKNNYN